MGDRRNDMKNMKKRGRPRGVRTSQKEKPFKSVHILIESSDGKGISAKVFKQQAV